MSPFISSQATRWILRLWKQRSEPQYLPSASTYYKTGTSLVTRTVKNLPAMQETQVLRSAGDLPSLNQGFFTFEMWSISCYISKQGCHSHQQHQPSRATRKESNTCRPAAIRLQPLPTVSTEERNRILAPDSWDVYERNGFRELGSCIFPYIEKH